MPSNRSLGAAPAGAQRWEQPRARPGPSTAAEMLARPPAGPGAMTGVAPAPGAPASRGSTRRPPPAARTHPRRVGWSRSPGLPGRAEGGRGLGHPGCRLLPAAARAGELCKKGVGGAAGASPSPVGAGLLGPGRRERRGPRRLSRNLKQNQTLAGPAGEGGWEAGSRGRGWGARNALAGGV